MHFFHHVWLLIIGWICLRINVHTHADVKAACRLVNQCLHQECKAFLTVCAPSPHRPRSRGCVEVPSHVGTGRSSSRQRSGSLGGDGVISGQVKGYGLAALRSADLNVGESGSLSLLTPVSAPSPAVSDPPPSSCLFVFHLSLLRILSCVHISFGFSLKLILKLYLKKQ